LSGKTKEDAMKALPFIVLFALVGVAGAAAEETASPRVLVADDLTWTTQGSADEGWRSVQVRSGDGHSSVSVPITRLDDAQGLGSGAGDGPVRFAIRREVGAAACVGSRKGKAAAGTCRFASDPGFEQGLAQRGVRLGKRNNLIALALVDAHLALVDELSREGLAMPDASDLIAASALGVTGAYVHELKAAGLALDKLGDVYAARALDVDAAFLREMAAAGYPKLTVSQAITMKAVGVTPAYAEAMNRAAGAARAVEGIGELQ
jgi:hypothetical protein